MTTETLTHGTISDVLAPLSKLGMTADQVVANILSYYHAASDETKAVAREWYTVERANIAELAEELDTSPELVTTVVAHLSPKKRWNENIKCARQLLETGTTYGMTAPIARAVGAVWAEHEGINPLSTLNGDKTRNFATNLLDASAIDIKSGKPAVTVDVWACRVAVADASANGAGDALQGKLSNKGMYEAIAECYRIAADIVNEIPANVQAITWVQIGGGK